MTKLRSLLRKPVESTSPARDNSAPYNLDREIQEILRLQHFLFPPGQRWSAESLREQIFDLARARGRNVAVTEDTNGVVSGLVAWVAHRESGAFFGAPFITGDLTAATLLTAELLAQARILRAQTIRVGAYDFEKSKIEALTRAGFQKIFDFVEMKIELINTSSAPAPAGSLEVFGDLHYVPAAAVNPLSYMKLYNETFKGVANAPPVNEAQARELWESPLVDRRFSGAWSDQSGTYVAFLIVNVAENGIAYIDSVGVDKSRRQRGFAKWIYARLFNLAGTTGIKTFEVMIADNNEASLRLHEAMGFLECGRRRMFELQLR